MQTIKRHFARAKQIYKSRVLWGLTNQSATEICRRFPSIGQRFAGTGASDERSTSEETRTSSPEERRSASASPEERGSTRDPDQERRASDVAAEDKLAQSKYTENMTDEEIARLAEAIEKEKAIWPNRHRTEVIKNEDVTENFKYRAIKVLRKELMPLDPETKQLIKFEPSQTGRKPPVDPQTVAYNEMRANTVPRTLRRPPLEVPSQRQDVYSSLRLEDDRYHQSRESTYPTKMRVQFIKGRSADAKEKYIYSTKKLEGLEHENNRQRFI